MLRLAGPDALRAATVRRPVATLGMFDGVHVGHRAVLDATRALAAERDGTATAITFDIHPREVVAGSGPPLLTSAAFRLRLLERAGVAAVVVLRFDAALREVAAVDFLRDMLVGRMGIAGLVLGPDSHYGRDRSGDVDTARRVLDPLGIPVRSVPPLVVDGAPVSSTRVRDAVASGALDRAAALLGRPVSLLGVVVRGDGRGRTLGFPTANLDVEGAMTPPRGVYVARATPDGESPRRALVNVGGRPTFLPPGSPTAVEAWLDGFDGDLYGRPVEVEFLARLRGERRFPDAAALARRLRADRDAMDAWFRRESLGSGAPRAPQSVSPVAGSTPRIRPDRRHGGTR